MKVKPVNYHGRAVLINKALGYVPIFSLELQKRAKQKKSNNVLVVGPAGQGKSYMGSDMCRVYEGLKRDGTDRFSVDQIVYRFMQYMDLTLHLRYYKAIEFDEPAWVMAKQEWFKEVVRALAKTMTTTRFKLHPIFIPVINRSLLEKTIREHLIDFQIEVKDRGIAYVYRVSHSQKSDKIYFRHICNLRYHLFDWDLCSRDSCLTCPKLWEGCMIFRAQYERKKSKIQEERYEEEYEKAQKKEMPQGTMAQLRWIEENFQDLLDPYKHDLSPRMVWVKLKVARSRAYDLVKAYKELHPEYWLAKQQEARVKDEDAKDSQALDDAISEFLKA